MKKRTFKMIQQADSPALSAIIYYWEDYTPHTVLIAYAELNRRNYPIDSRLIKRLTAFCAANNGANIETLLFDELKHIGYTTYEEYYEKEIISIDETAQEQISIYDHSSKNRNQRINLFKTLSGIFLFLGIVSSIVIFATVGIDDREWRTEFNAGGIMSAIMTLFMSFFIYYGCRMIIYIAEQVTPNAEDKA